MSETTLPLAGRIAALTDAVTVTEGGCKAETAGVVFEGNSPSALAHTLADALYQTLHTGRAKPSDSHQRTLRERDFDEALHEATGPRTTAVSGRHLADDEHGAIVDIQGLRLRVPGDSLAERSGESVTVALPCARPGLSPGFFLATSGKAPFRSSGPLLRLYGRLEDPSAAPSVWGALVDFLEDAGIPWQAKILSSRSQYPRNDAVVVYLPRPAWRVARPCAEMLQGTGLLGQGISPFVSPLTESVGCAFEPDDQHPSRRGQSFGQHRTRVFAEALIRHAALPPEDDSPVTDIIYGAFVEAGIDPSEPARNLSSPFADVLKPF
jgi:hypothetical protein